MHASDLLNVHVERVTRKGEGPALRVRDVADAAFARFAGAASAADGAPVATYGEFQAAVNRSLRTGDTAKARRLAAIDNRIQQIISRQHIILRRRNPSLDQALLRTGRVSVLQPGNRVGA